MIITTGLKRKQIQAFLEEAQQALINQDEFFTIINREGAAALLDEYSRRGVLNYSKLTRHEMNFELMANQDYYTNNSLFFTSGHGSVPSIDIRKWSLTIEGDGVENPLSLNYDELMKLPYTSVTRYLESAGNGRAFYNLLLNKKAQSPQWHFGGYGIAEWTGVKLSEILKIAGIKDTAVDIMPVGSDSPSEGMPIPIEKAMEEDTILAYIMNGRILPPDHGFPLRAIVPGWIGAYSSKWIEKIIVSTKPIYVSNNTEKYVLIGPDFAPQPPAKGPVITTQVVKSACCLPWPASLESGTQEIIGYAWSPFGTIAKVDISIDGGKTFLPATLVGPNIERAGTRWEFVFDAKPGNITITPRATDDQGYTQYDISEQKWNQKGYLFGAMVPHPVTILKHHCSDETFADYSMLIPPTGGCC